MRKGAYSYEYMDEWEKLYKTLFPEKKFFYSKLNMEDNIDSNYMHVRRVLILADVFENFKKMCSKIHHLDPVKFLLAPGLA